MEKKEKAISKKDRVIIKCEKCGFKYYDGDVHLCKGGGVKEKTEEKPKGKKLTIKSQKDSFKMWNDS